MTDYEKSSVVTYPFYFINRQSIHKRNCMQRLKKILMPEVFPAIALKGRRFVLSLQIVKILAKCDILSGFSLFAKVPVCGYLYEKGY